MSTWKLHVEGLGKIENVDIEVAPLTLFVGDNNSGKSYLLTLLWGMHTLGQQQLLSRNNYREFKEGNNLLEWFDRIRKEFDENKTEIVVDLDEKINEFECFINILIKRNKDKFIESIFNSDKVKIKDMSIKFLKNKLYKLKIYSDNNATVRLSYGKRAMGFSYDFWNEEGKMHDFTNLFAIQFIIGALLGISGGRQMGEENTIFLPAARTGFMLTKDTINKVGRQKTFDLDILEDKEINLQPFTKPVIQFLDIMDGLTTDNVKSRRREWLVGFIEDNMLNGAIRLANSPGKEINYFPNGSKDSMPLRVTSAVVSELSPLVLLLKHKKDISQIFYEEPEMCLHPQLQKVVARVLCLLVKSGMTIVATTHSDIIIQHINNMIKISSMINDKAKLIMDHFDYVKDELISPNEVKVYQLQNKNNHETEITELKCTAYGFEVPSFNDALDKLMDEIYKIQE